MDSAANLARPRPRQGVFLPIKQKKDGSHPASPSKLYECTHHLINIIDYMY